jgi:hypothetical protein
MFVEQITFWNVYDLTTGKIEKVHFHDTSYYEDWYDRSQIVYPEGVTPPDIGPEPEIIPQAPLEPSQFGINKGVILSLNQLNGDFWGIYYVDTNTTTVIDRPNNTSTISKTSILANGTDKAIISGISIGTPIKISDGFGITELIADGTALDILSNAADTITIEIDSFPERRKRYEVIAT